MTTEKDEEAAALRKRFDGINQREFLREHKMKLTASMLGQNLSGHRPITLKAAIDLARAFKCKLADISPRIAAAVAAAQGLDIGDIPHEAPDLVTCLQVVADAFAGASPAIREQAGALLAIVLANPHAHAVDQIPIIARKLLGESDALAA